MTMSDPGAALVILGAGQHAQVLVDALRAAGHSPPGCLIDRTPHPPGASRYGVALRGDDERIARLRDEGITYFLIGVGSTRSSSLRGRLFQAAVDAGLTPWTLRHPAALCSASAEIGAGSQILAGAIVGAMARLAENVIVNTGAIVEHDCRIGPHSHLATGARLGGGVIVEQNVHVGLGACVIQGVRIGAGATVGAGAVVLRDVAPGAVVIGVPARPLDRTHESSRKAG